jgi:hypothetical protein
MDVMWTVTLRIGFVCLNQSWIYSFWRMVAMKIWRPFLAKKKKTVLGYVQ